MDIILFFQSTLRKSWRQKLSGVHLYSQKRGWFVHVIEKFSSADEIRRALRNWKPVGCLVDRAMSNAASPDHLFGDIPTVYLDQHTDKASKRHPCLLHDSAAEAALAGGELLSLGCASYAYLGTGKGYFWDAERLVRFERDVRKAGIPFFVLPNDNLKSAIHSLPKPCGILGANDSCATEAFHAAVANGFDIPSDVAIAGIDNDELYCDSVSPGITSAEPDFEGAGYRLCQMLDAEIERTRRGAKARKRPYIETYGPVRLVRRGSTFVQKGLDPRVRRAQEFIRRNACSDKISLNAVVTEMKCSKRLATMLFKKATGRTIFDEIHEIRMQKACDLLSRTTLPIGTVSVQCGYNSESFLKRMFLKRTGLTMRAYRKKASQTMRKPPPLMSRGMAPAT